MVVLNYKPICGCGNPLKIFASSGRIQKVCTDCAADRYLEKQFGSCVDCGKQITRASTRCAKCAIKLSVLKRPMHALRCQWCDKEFESKNRGAMYCCQRCHDQAANRKRFPNPRKRLEPSVCKGCGKMFKPKHGGHNKGLYCSRICAFDHVKDWQSTAGQMKEGWRKHPNAPGPHCNVFFKSCANCGISFATRWDKRLTCSDACALAVNLAQKRAAYDPKPARTIACATCGSMFSTNKPTAAYCSPSCIPRRTNARDRARHAGVPYEFVNAMRVLNRDGWRCQICGKATPRDRRGTRYSNAPEVDHRIPLALGGPHTYENVQCACRACNAAKGGTTTVGQLPLLSC